MTITDRVSFPTPIRRLETAKDGQNLFSRYTGQFSQVIKGDQLCVGSFIMIGVEGGMLVAESAAGKTLTTETMAACIGGVSRRIQFVPDTVASDLTGYYSRDPLTGDKIYVPGPFEGSHVVLADEINRNELAIPGLLEMWGEKKITVGDRVYYAEPALTIVATKNPDGYDRTARQTSPALQSRIPLKLWVDDITLADEVDIALGKIKSPSDIDPVMTPHDVVALRKLMRRVVQNTKGEIAEFGIRHIRATRENEALERGADKRASVYLMRVAAMLAIIDGRDGITKEDIIVAFAMVVAGRIEPKDYMSEREIYQFCKELIK